MVLPALMLAVLIKALLVSTISSVAVKVVAAAFFIFTYTTTSSGSMVKEMVWLWSAGFTSGRLFTPKMLERSSTNSIS